MTPSAAPPPPAAAAVSISVLNATTKDGLAHQVAAALRARGFRIVRVGNTGVAVTGAGTIFYGAGGAGAARTLAEHIPGAAVRGGRAAGVSFAIGPSFRHLAPPAAAAAARARDLAAASPRPAVCASS